MKFATLLLALYATTTMAQTSTTAHDDSRWEFICRTAENEPVYIDKQSVRWKTRDGQVTSRLTAYYVEFWEKIMPSVNRFGDSAAADKDSKTDTKDANSDETIRMLRIQMERTTKRIRTLSYARYDASGKLLSASSEPAAWCDIIPDTIGEDLYNYLFPPKQQGKYSMSDLAPEETKPKKQD
jgi:hypothetical protein